VAYGISVRLYRQTLNYRVAASPRYKIKVGSKRLSIPVHLTQASRLVRDWAPSWKTEVIRQFLTVSPGIFIDVGTNIGDTFLDFLEAAGNDRQYIGFEPNPVCALTVSAIIETNRLANASLVPVGLSDRNGIFELLTRPGNPSDREASLLVGVRPTWKYERQWVPCFKFSDIANDLKLNAISFIKIDVEGAELLVLRGMKERLMGARAPILCEVLHRDPAANAIEYSDHISGLKAILESIDYLIFRIDRRGSNVGYVPCDEFPNVVFTAESGDLCDYIFIPSERAMILSK
jgi:FkbM family methyltransferase